jgi:branched-chain amino acid aminotransferase
MAKPVIKPYAPFLLDPSARVFHYGQAIFEGMKAYKDESDDVWLFALMKITNDSTIQHSMAMPEVPETIFMDGSKRIIKNRPGLIKKGKRKYIVHQTIYDSDR